MINLGNDSINTLFDGLHRFSVFDGSRINAVHTVGTRSPLLQLLDNDAGYLFCALATFKEAVIDNTAYTQFFLAMVYQALYFLIGVVGITIERNNDVSLPLTQVVDMLVKIFKTFLETFNVWLFYLALLYSAVHLQTVACRYYYHQVGQAVELTALDVQKFLCAQVSTESCLCDNIVTDRKACLGRQYGVTSMGDIGKRSAMDDDRRIFCRLHEVRLQRIL